MPTSRIAALRRYRQIAPFSRDILQTPLFPYQRPIAEAIADAVAQHRTEEIYVEMCRQSGKNEVSAHVETHLLATHARRGGTIVKAAPTWSPQIVRSKHRLESVAGRATHRLPFLRFQGREGYIIQCGAAMISFLSGRPTANVVGETASRLMEIDEAQDFDQEKYDKDLSPMRASTGAPAVFYGTPWTDATLLERGKTAVIEGRVKGQIFRVPWERVAEDNPIYGDFVQSEIDRLGAEHPIIKTQYRLIPIPEQGRFLSTQQLRQMMGDHPPGGQIEPGQIVAGLDFAGADEDAPALASAAAFSRRDSVALTIGRCQWIPIAAGVIVPMIWMTARYEWVNVDPVSLHTTLYQLLNRHRVARCHADATGIGETGTALLARALNRGDGERVVGIKSDSAWNASTRMAFQYMAVVNGSRLIDHAPDGFDPIVVARQESPPGRDQDPARHAWWQRGNARLDAKPGKKVKVHVPESKGHDDLLSSELLMVDAAYATQTPTGSGLLVQRAARGWQPEGV